MTWKEWRKAIVWMLSGVAVSIAIGMALRVDAGAYAEGFDHSRIRRQLHEFYSSGIG